MDRAQAAEMSDPDRNWHFRRRWCEVPAAKVGIRIGSPVPPQLGTLGYALLEAFARARSAELADLGEPHIRGVPR